MGDGDTMTLFLLTTYIRREDILGTGEVVLVMVDCVNKSAYGNCYS